VTVLCTAAVLHAEQFGPWQPSVSVDPGRTGVNSSANDGCPIEAPDGRMLLFASNRPGTLGFNDIWLSFRASEDDAWGTPVNLGGPVNSPAQDFCPTPLSGYRLLFVSTRANNCGGPGNNPDIYFTQWNPVHGWRPPQPLSCNVNSGLEEFSPSVVESDGVTVLFFSSSRDTAPLHKIFMSVLQPDGTLSPAMPVDELNAEGASDARPNVRKDGLEIVFDSTRGGGPPQIYTATRASIFDPWSPPVLLDANVNATAFAQTRASLSRDGKRLYFGSTRANGPGDPPGSADVFVATRSGPGRQSPR
jgi:Tol biopolymer transport system component